MYFGTKSYLKSNHYHTPKHPLSLANTRLNVSRFDTLSSPIINWVWSTQQGLSLALTSPNYLLNLDSVRPVSSYIYIRKCLVVAHISSTLRIQKNYKCMFSLIQYIFLGKHI
jgi:hypothetical protein